MVYYISNNIKEVVMAEIFAVFIDIDGTLTSKKGHIPEKNLEALTRAQKQGHKIFINTGRSRGNISDGLFDELSFADGMVCGNGCHIILDGRDVFKRFIPVKVLTKLIDYIIERPDIWCVFEGEKELFYLEDFKKTRKDNSGKIPLVSAAEFEKNYSHCAIEVVAAGPKLPPDFEKTFENELNVFRLDTYADCVAHGCCKADGMQKVLDIFGIDRAHTIAIGDSENDRNMLEFAGTAVVMGNAPAAIKETADFVTLSNDEAGVAFAVEKLIFGV